MRGNKIFLITSESFQVHLHEHENQQHQEKGPGSPNLLLRLAGIYGQIV